MLGATAIRCMIQSQQQLCPFRVEGQLIQVQEGDLRSKSFCAHFCEGFKDGVLIHTAGVIHPRYVHDFYSVNMQGTENLLRAAVAAGVRRFVAVSSNSPCGCNPRRDHRFTEESPYNPYMNYGRSKMLMEQVIQSFGTRGAIETVIVRAPWFYGPGQPPRQSLFFRMIREGRVPLIGDGNAPRSMVYIHNLCDGLVLAATHENAVSETFWIADEHPYSMNEIVETIRNVMRTSFGIVCSNRCIQLPDITGILATYVDAAIQALGFYSQKIHVLSEMNKTIACDISKARARLNYQPRVSLHEGMYRSLLWMQEHGIAW